MTHTQKGYSCTNCMVFKRFVFFSLTQIMLNDGVFFFNFWVVFKLLELYTMTWITWITDLQVTVWIILNDGFLDFFFILLGLCTMVMVCKRFNSSFFLFVLILWLIHNDGTDAGYVNLDVQHVTIKLAFSWFLFITD